ncbi:DUF2079 domain-containing protein [Streptacidiphilus sp. PAMC 29251]
MHLQTTGFDLGIFEEGVRGYAHLRAPVAALKGTGFSLLGDHFSPVLALLAPVYRVFPHALTLQLAQAVLFAASVVPVTRFAVRSIGGAGTGLRLGVAYGLSWGLWQAVSCDFHEIAFAVPLIAFAVEALACARYRAAVCWALPLLLVKEDQGLLLAGLGLYVFGCGRRLLGAATVAAAAAVTALAVFVLVPAANPDGVYSYASQAGNGSWQGTDAKGTTLLILLAPTLLLALRSPLVLLLALPLAARFSALQPEYWSTREHYNATLMPVLFLAFADALRRPGWGRAARRAVTTAALLVGVALTASMVPLPQLAPPGPVVRAELRALSVIPDGARVAAANQLAPQLTGRCTVSLFPYLTPPDASGPWSRPVADWVATLDDPGDFPLPKRQLITAEEGLTPLGYREVAKGAGVTVYRWEDRRPTALPARSTAPPPGRCRRGPGRC